MKPPLGDRDTAHDSGTVAVAITLGAIWFAKTNGTMFWKISRNDTTIAATAAIMANSIPLFGKTYRPQVIYQILRYIKVLV